MILEMDAGIILSNPVAKTYLIAALKRMGTQEDLIDLIVRQTIYERDKKGDWQNIPELTAAFCMGYSSALDARDAGTTLAKMQEVL